MTLTIFLSPQQEKLCVPSLEVSLAPCKAEMDAILRHAAKMQNVAVDLIAKLRADRPRYRP